MDNYGFSSAASSQSSKENRFKLCFFDVGLLGAMSGIATFLNYNFGSYQGYVAENFVAQELRAVWHLNK